MITFREHVILAVMQKSEIFAERCAHHSKVIADPELTAALAAYQAATERVQKAATNSLLNQGGAPLTPAWHIGEAATK